MKVSADPFRVENPSAQVRGSDMVVHTSWVHTLGVYVDNVLAFEN